MDKFSPALPVPEGVQNGQVRPRATVREAMMYAAEMGRRSPWPDNYRWSAIWWRLHARESRNARDALLYSSNQLALFRDALARPEHYQRKPLDLTDWEWSGLQAVLQERGPAGLRAWSRGRRAAAASAPVRP